MKKILISTAIAATLALPGLAMSTDGFPTTPKEAITSGAYVAAGGSISVSGSGNQSGSAYQRSSGTARNTTNAYSGNLRANPVDVLSRVHEPAVLQSKYIGKHGIEAITESRGFVKTESEGLLSGRGASGYTSAYAEQGGTATSSVKAKENKNLVKVDSLSSVYSNAFTESLGTGKATQKSRVRTDNISVATYGRKEKNSVNRVKLVGITAGSTFAKSLGTKSGQTYGDTSAYSHEDGEAKGYLKAKGDLEIAELFNGGNPAFAYQNSRSESGNINNGSTKRTGDSGAAIIGKARHKVLSNGGVKNRVKLKTYQKGSIGGWKRGGTPGYSEVNAGTFIEGLAGIKRSAAGDEYIP